MKATEIKALADALRANIAKVVVGKEDVVDKVLAALLAGGHVLLEDVPGTGKTVMARSLAKSLACGFSRVVFSPKSENFTFKPGPIFANIVLADEINRATPRAQSAMLECMEEKQVSSDGTTYPLPAPFFVIATQNPVETQGTFPLPEAQLDRFMVQLSMGYPTREEQTAILQRFMQESPQESLRPVANAEQIAQAQKAVRSVRVAPELLDYIGALCEKTRALDDALLGASPRAALALMRVSQSLAAIRGRDYVTPEDIKTMAEPVLAHRLILRTAYGRRGRAAEAVGEVLASVPVPTETIE